jgi:hypothetical protein
MMFRPSIAGTSAWKLGAIPVLVAVLFKVTRTSTPDVETPAQAVQEQASVATKAEAARPPVALPELSLNDALKFNPFGALPRAERKTEEPPVVVETPVTQQELSPSSQPATPAVNPLVEKAATLKQLKVSAVFSSPKGSVAIIDSKTVRAGDLLSPGVRVVEIRDTDVILRVENGEAAPGAATGGASLR